MPNRSHNLLNYLRVAVGAWRDDPRDDAALLGRFAESGDEAAFRALVWRHGGLVWQTCQHIVGSTPDAEDTFQTTFLALARQAGQLRREPLAGWLHWVARRAALNARASARRRRGLEQWLGTVKQPVSEGRDADRAELYAALYEELAELPEKLRVPLLLHYLEGKSQDEVAHILGCSRGVVRKRLARSEATLRERLERRGLTVGLVSVGALLGSTSGASAVPARLIGNTARAAVAFRSGTLTGRSVEAARTVLGVLPSSIEMTIMRKSLWIVLACVCSFGVGLAAWQASSSHSEAVESPEVVESPKVSAEPGSERVDRFDDPLPPGALTRLGTQRLRHVGDLFNSGAESVVFSRDGKAFLTAGLGNPIRLWDASTGKLLCAFGDSHENPARFIALSPAGNILAAINRNGSVSLWEVATGKLLRQLAGPNRADALAFSRDGRTLLSADGSHHLRVWEVATGKQVHDQPLRIAEAERREGGSLSTILFSPDGKTLASIYSIRDNNDSTRDNDKVVYLWEVASGKELYHLSLGGKERPPRDAIAFSPDSRFLAVSSFTMLPENRSDGAVHLWEVATGKEVRKWAPDKAWTFSLAFSPDGKLLATGSGFGPIRLWETATGKEVRRCQDYQAHVVALAFSPDGGTLASLAKRNDHTVRLWEVATGKERTRASRGHGHVGPVLSVTFSPDGKSLISGGRDGLVCLWNPQTGQEQHPPLRVGDFQALAVLSADGKTIVSVGNSFSPNYQALMEVAHKTPTQICVWDRATGQKLRQFEGPAAGCPQSLALSPDGKILVLTCLNSAHLLEVATGKEKRCWSNAQRCCVALSPDGKTLALTRDGLVGGRGIVRFYATATGGDGGEIRAQRDGVECLAFSPDGQTLATGGRENLPAEGNNFLAAARFTIRLWRVGADKHWKKAGEPVGYQDEVWGLTFSPDGKTLACASADGTLRLWEVATGQERRRFAGHRGKVWCLAFAPDGRRLAAGGNDTTILVWDVTGRLHNGQLHPMKLSAQEVKSLWADLAGADAVRAGQAIWTLAAVPAQALPPLREYLRPVAPAGPRVIRLLADLERDSFAVRQKAADELEKLGEVAAPALRVALAKKSVSLEMRRRLRQLLEPLEKEELFPPRAGEKVRSLRALEVLGQIAMPEARQLLESLAQGAPGTPLTREAQATLKWLRTRVNRTKP